MFKFLERMKCLLSIKTYSEILKFKTFEERFEYLKLSARVGIDTFGHKRFLNQMFYRSDVWRNFRRDILIRDNGCDLGCDNHPIFGRIEIHHINPITVEDIQQGNPCLVDPENVICVSSNTHKAIHYGDSSIIQQDLIERFPYDTCPWKL